MDYKKGLWTVEEDKILMDYISKNGEGKWNRIAKNTGLKRCGKSCRLRWLNYLCPSVKRGDFSEQEDDLIIRLHKLLGNRWSLIAGRVPGRTDNQVKNYWNSHLSKKLGISKDKKKLGTAMKLSRKGGEEKEIIRLVGDSTSKSSSDGGDSRVVGSSQVKEGTQNAIKAPDPQEPEMSECYWSSNWLPNDHLDQNIPSLMELLNGYPFDEVWHDF